MTEELKNYLIWYCREWMLPEEIRALERMPLFGYDVEEFKIAIANRILNDHYEEVINNCPKCGKLARTPKAKQCRYCQFDWH